MERDREQPLLAARLHETPDVEERRRPIAPVDRDPDPARLLDDVEPARLFDGAARARASPRSGTA
jgi:hypothetical protein